MLCCLRRLAVLCLLVAPPVCGADDFPKPFDTEPASSGKPLPPDEATALIRVPEGFRVNLFAAEPEVRNPIAMSWDARGRLWIAENYTYAETPKRFELGLRDRIVIFEDRNGDGRHDARRVFTDDLQMLTGLEVGLGGVWCMCPPQLLFIPDRNRDDVPDGPAELVLDGFTVPPANAHNYANGLRFGPDGWLYGRCGASAPGRVGLPGTPDEQRIPLNGGVWRYHPRRKVYETLCHGTTNPWGHDWNEHGECFFINTVNGHLWHMMSGAHFKRPHTIDPNPRVYETIDMHADHWHWDTGKDWTDSRKATGEHDRLGGGHAHVGCMIYLGDQWPEQYRGRLFTINMHGRRVNCERLDRAGSGYVARHEPDMIFAGDPWFRGVELGYGPDGSVFILDWSDGGECHENDGVHRSSGRIYRISYGEPKPLEPFDLGTRTPDELVELHKHKNEWYVRQARLELLRRAATGGDVAGAAEALKNVVLSAADDRLRLRALLTSGALGPALPFAPSKANKTEKPWNDHLLAWALRFRSDECPHDTILAATPSNGSWPASGDASQACGDEAATSPFVRLTIASTLQRLKTSARLGVAKKLLAYSEDAGDHNLPLMIWYGLIPVADEYPGELAELATGECFPLVRKFITRRLTEDLEKKPQYVNAIIEAAVARSAAFQGDVVAGLSEGLAGWRKAPKPKAWDELVAAIEKSDNSRLRDQTRQLSIVFGDGRALDEVRRVALDKDADFNQRRAALQTLIDNRPDDLRKICESLLSDRYLKITAARGLTLFDDPKIAVKLASGYRNVPNGERATMMDVLVSRPVFARAMLDEMAAGKIPRADLTAFQVRQIRSFGDTALTGRLTEVWGELRDTSADKQQLIVRLKNRLTPEHLASADTSAGRLVFNTLCANCHRLYGHGAEIGPDLTGAGRQNLDYLLSNIVDPSAVVTADFRMSVVVLDDGRVLNGILTARTKRTITVQTAKEKIVVPRDDIDELQPSQLSLMPEGQMQPLRDEQIRDLIAYLMTRSQVPLPQTAAQP